jgi:hypothetical protein
MPVKTGMVVTGIDTTDLLIQISGIQKIINPKKIANNKSFCLS